MVYLTVICKADRLYTKLYIIYKFITRLNESTNDVINWQYHHLISDGFLVFIYKALLGNKDKFMCTMTWCNNAKQLIISYMCTFTWHYINIESGPTQFDDFRNYF